jgi:hypothetical protein
VRRWQEKGSATAGVCLPPHMRFSSAYLHVLASLLVW